MLKYDSKYHFVGPMWSKMVRGTFFRSAGRISDFYGPLINKDVSSYVADSVTSLAVDTDVSVVDEAESVGFVASLVGEDRQVLGEVETIGFGERIVGQFTPSGSGHLYFIKED